MHKTKKQWCHFTTDNYPLCQYNFTAVQKQVQRYVNELSKDEDLKEIFDNNKVILSKRQPKNLLRHLTNAKFSNETNIIENGVHKCKRKNCKICEMYLQEDKEFELSSGKTWKVKNVVTCKAKNVIYYITCNRCQGKTTYIGKTVDLKSRTNVHITGCRHGNGPNKFDNHVYSCNKESTQLTEPYFKLYCMMIFDNEKPLLTYEAYLQKQRHDTMNHWLLLYLLLIPLP